MDSLNLSIPFKDDGFKQDTTDTDFLIQQQIEFLIQKQLNIAIPALIFDFTISNSVLNSTNEPNFDIEDLTDVLTHFGKFEQIETSYPKIICFHFSKFFDAYNAKEFLLNESNYKESELSCLNIKWINHMTDMSLFEQIKSKLHLKQTNTSPSKTPLSCHSSSYSYSDSKTTQLTCSSPQNVIDFSNKNLYSVFQNYNTTRNDYIKSMELSNNKKSMSAISPYSIDNTLNQRNHLNLETKTSSNNISNNLIKQSSGNMGSNNKVNSNNSLNNSGLGVNSSILKTGNNNGSGNIANDLDDKKNSEKYMINGKYTCRFEIQIENDNQFQVARKIIGSNGCNMKKIVELCNTNQDGTYWRDSVKLRLRGKGSGYKEGPSKQESDEPLHLCISSKYYEKFRLASVLLTDLLTTIYDEYKKTYDKNSKYYIPNLGIKKTEGISSRKNTKNDFDD